MFSSYLRIKSISLTVIIPIATTLMADVIAVCGVLYSEINPTLAKFLIVINFLLFAIFFYNFYLNLFGEQKIILIKENRTLGKIYFVIQCIFILTMYFPLLFWAIGLFKY